MVSQSEAYSKDKKLDLDELYLMTPWDQKLDDSIIVGQKSEGWQKYGRIFKRQKRIIANFSQKAENGHRWAHGRVELSGP